MKKTYRPVPAEEVFADLPPERRARIEARAEVIIAEELALRDLRKAKQFTQEQVARRLGGREVYVSRDSRTGQNEIVDVAGLCRRDRRRPSVDGHVSRRSIRQVEGHWNGGEISREGSQGCCVRRQAPFGAVLTALTELGAGTTTAIVAACDGTVINRSRFAEEPCRTPPMLAYANYRTPAEFDAGYANSIDQAVVARWESFFREASRKVAGRPKVELAYGADGRNRIDFFPAPNAAAGAPVLIAIHGGLWFLFDKWMMHFLVPAFTAAGVHVACPNYRLAPQAGLDDIVTDCRNAIAFLNLNPGATGVSLGRFSVTGHSAAGQLAAVMASTDWPGFNPRLPAKLISSWIGVSGFYDIEPFAQTGFQAQTAFTMDAYRRCNPVNLVHAGMPPAVLITGSKESGLLHAMMEGYAALLRRAEIPVRTVDAPEECHFSVLSRLGDAGSDVHRLVLDTVRAHARQREP